MTSEQITALGPAFTAFTQSFSSCFPRSDTRRHLATYGRGLLSDLPRKSVEPIALASGTAVRMAALIGCLIAIASYAFVVWRWYVGLVRDFDMTMRKQAGN